MQSATRHVSVWVRHGGPVLWGWGDPSRGRKQLIKDPMHGRLQIMLNGDQTCRVQPKAASASASCTPRATKDGVNFDGVVSGQTVCKPLRLSTGGRCASKAKVKSRARWRTVDCGTSTTRASGQTRYTLTRSRHPTALSESVTGTVPEIDATSPSPLTLTPGAGSALTAPRI